ncbi:hypothetical protein R5W24_000513 [Gemmata sp. JC717]|uniref:hypothetical protein n=1 Tax=Gemmata algarum TaxID=2975278 RepID=UPI0021BA92B0|nr:hypothetical protein [Gemmata algarum]MDY3551437.1 hypothetical protein [Gemmata algarum]
MKRVYNHHTHSYEYRPTRYAVIDHLANSRGVHHVYDKHQRTIDQGSSLIPWIVAGLFLYAVFCAQTPQPEPEKLLSMCLMGVCL